MEIELKYYLNDEIAKERIFNDKHLTEIKDPDFDETIEMKAVYMDTAQKDLMKKEMAFRVRREGERMVATLKWGGSAKDGLHVRGELNVPVDEQFVRSPNVDVFKGSEIYEEIKAAAGDRALQKVMEMDFTRKEIRVDTGKSISVISLDEGWIRTDGGDAPISELEIEFYSGDQDDMIELGMELAAKYNLQTSDKSKYQRGLELLEIAPDWENKIGNEPEKKDKFK